MPFEPFNFGRKLGIADVSRIANPIISSEPLLGDKGGRGIQGGGRDNPLNPTPPSKEDEDEGDNPLDPKPRGNSGEGKGDIEPVDLWYPQPYEIPWDPLAPSGTLGSALPGWKTGNWSENYTGSGGRRHAPTVPIEHVPFPYPIEDSKPDFYWPSRTKNIEHTQCSPQRIKQLEAAFLDIMSLDCFNKYSYERLIGGEQWKIFESIKNAIISTWMSGLKIICAPKDECPHPKTFVTGQVVGGAKLKYPVIRLCEPASFNAPLTGRNAYGKPITAKMWLKYNLLHELVHAAGGNEIDAEVIEAMCLDNPDSYFSEIDKYQDRDKALPGGFKDDWTTLDEELDLGIGQKVKEGGRTYIRGKWFYLSLNNGNIYNIAKYLPSETIYGWMNIRHKLPLGKKTHYEE